MASVLLVVLMAVAGIPALAQAPDTNEDITSHTYLLSVPNSPLNPPKKFVAYNPCSCISYFKYRRGITEPMVSPKWWWNTGHAYTNITPSEGLGVILAEGPVWHIAVIDSVSSTSMTYTSANEQPCKVTTNTIPLDSSLIMGYL